MKPSLALLFAALALSAPVYATPIYDNTQSLVGIGTTGLVMSAYAETNLGPTQGGAIGGEGQRMISAGTLQPDYLYISVFANSATNQGTSQVKITSYYHGAYECDLTAVNTDCSWSVNYPAAVPATFKIGNTTYSGVRLPFVQGDIFQLYFQAWAPFLGVYSSAGISAAMSVGDINGNMSVLSLAPFAVTPEPGTWAMLLGAGGIAALIRKR